MNPRTPSHTTIPTRSRPAAVLLAALGLLAAGLVLAASGPATPAGAAPPDPATPGPYATTTQDYDFGDTAFTPPGFPGPVEVIGRVYRPSSLADGPFPLVLLLHGRHSTCSFGSSGYLQWPCEAWQTPIPSYLGYEYLAQNLASHGAIVVSVSANGVNARDNSVFDLGADARARLLQLHLDLWDDWNTTGGSPFGSTYVGKVDLQNVGTMGHSRGGEGVVQHYVHNQSLGSPYGIQAVVPLAPVDFNRPVVNDVPIQVILPYCDGDVSDLQGIHFFDDALYNVPGDTAPKFSALVMGANHNYFNTIWTPGGWPASAFDDWGFVSGGSGDPHCGSSGDRLTAAQQRSVGTAYISGWLRYVLLDQTDLEPIYTGTAGAPPSTSPAEIFPGYHPADDSDLRFDVNPFIDATDLVTNDTGGSLTPNGLSPYAMCGGLSPQPQHCLSGSTSRQPHTTPSARSSKRGLPQVELGWNSTAARLRNNIGGGGVDASRYDYLQFRATVDFSDGRNPNGVPQDFTVVLGDGTGVVDVAVSSVSDGLVYPPGSTGPVPKVYLRTIRIPTSLFSAIDLTDVDWIRFDFDQTSSGALLISDLAFVNDPSGGGTPPPTGSCFGQPATISGTSGPDVIVGTPGDDVIVGFAGNDSIDGGGGNDIICGNEGDDTIDGGAGDDLLVGNADDDTIDGGPGNDDIQGSAGSDTASFESSSAGVSADLTTNTASGDGSDTLSSIEHLIGSDHADVLSGNGQDNHLEGRAGPDLIDGSAGNDVLRGEGGPDDLRGGPGDDILEGGAAGDLLRGDGDDDTIVGGNATDTVVYTTATVGVTVDLGAGTATGHGSDTISGVEDIIGSQQGDDLTGDGGPNKIQGRGGDDVVDGAGGDDDVRGNGGSDTVLGGEGNDQVRGGSAGDILDGGPGDDAIDGQTGAPDQCEGGPGTDTHVGGCEVLSGIP